MWLKKLQVFGKVNTVADGMTRKLGPRTVVEVKQEHGRYVCDM